MTNSEKPKLNLINKRQLLAIVPLSYSSIWDLMRTGDFPLSVRIGSRVYWRAREIEAWLAALPRSQYGGKSAPRKTLRKSTGDAQAAKQTAGATDPSAPK